MESSAANQVAAALRSAERSPTSLETVLAVLPVGVLVFDARGRLEFVNAHAEAVLGLASHELAGAVADDVWLVRDERGRIVPRAEQAHARALATGAPVAPEPVELELPDGRRLVVERSATPLVVDGTVTAVIVAFRDVTEREQRGRAERDFVTNAAHELQTPIAAITSAIEVLQAGAKDDPQDRDRFLGHIEVASDRLARLTRALLVLARAQTRDEVPRSELVEVQELLRAVEQGLGGADVVVDCDPSLAVISNRALLLQALANLAENAMKHTSGPVTLGAERVGDRVLIRVSDRGAGIPVSERGSIFERFYRRGDAVGFGLGLAIVREAVDALGGELSLESSAAGTCVSVSLPGARVRGR